jgi:hypothetical protein
MELGFIILRHVNSSETNKYWIESYESVRKYYPECHILIIDDNSNREYLTNIKLYRTTIVYGEYPGRGELLPYYYYLKYKLFDTAVIIHDSVFINSHIDFNVDKYKIMWDFQHNWDQPEDETKMIKLFEDEELLKFYEDKSLWRGCFGGMSIITHDFLTSLNKKYDLSKLLDVVLTRYNRMSFERVIGCLLQKHYKLQLLYGDILQYTPWNISYENRYMVNYLPIIKVWTGR